ncbi:MAG: threonylcarbamoyl-AMP synthase [Candidatus Pacebacteria bacterium]|nr:threonylcarbamoyl-AMP synthase [Candidatus Paceibacterota bacterium]
MNTIRLSEEGSITEAVQTLEQGGIIVYPTDTIYGIGADPLNEEAIKKVFSTKARDGGRALSVIASDRVQAESYGIFTKDAQKLADTFWPGALTLVVFARDKELSQKIHAGDTVGIRVPDNTWCREVVERFGRPIVSTSANPGGKATEHTIEAIKNSLDANASYVDLWIDGGEINNDVPSTVVWCADEKTEILREGAISRDEIEKVLQ